MHVMIHVKNEQKRAFQAYTPNSFLNRKFFLAKPDQMRSSIYSGPKKKNMLPPNTSFAHSKISKSHMVVYYTSILNLRVLTRAR
jgi:hypothetical protein